MDALDPYEQWLANGQAARELVENAVPIGELADEEGAKPVERTASALPLAITVHRSLDRARGQRVSLAGGEGLRGRLTPAERLVFEIERLTGEDAWWSPAVFTGDHRRGDRWDYTSASAADIDYHNGDGEHAEVPADVRAAIDGALATAPASLMHHTPRGFRLVDVFDEPIDAREIAQLTLLELIEDVLDWLKVTALEGLGLRVDASVTKDLARYYWAPCAVVDGKPRHAIVQHAGEAR